LPKQLERTERKRLAGERKRKGGRGEIVSGEWIWDMILVDVQRYMTKEERDERRR